MPACRSASRPTFMRCMPWPEGVSAPVGAPSRWTSLKRRAPPCALLRIRYRAMPWVGRYQEVRAECRGGLACRRRLLRVGDEARMAAGPPLASRVRRGRTPPCQARHELPPHRPCDSQPVWRPRFASAGLGDAPLERATLAEATSPVPGCKLASALRSLLSLGSRVGLSCLWTGAGSSLAQARFRQLARCSPRAA